MVRSSGSGRTPSLLSSQATAAAPTWAHGSASRRARTFSTSASSSALLLLATTAGARDREPAQSARFGW